MRAIRRDGQLLDSIRQVGRPGALPWGTQHLGRCIQECSWYPKGSLEGAIIDLEKREYQGQRRECSKSEKLQVADWDGADEHLLGHSWLGRGLPHPQLEQRRGEGFLLQDEGGLPALHCWVFFKWPAHYNRPKSTKSLRGGFRTGQVVIEQYAPSQARPRPQPLRLPLWDLAKPWEGLCNGSNSFRWSDCWSGQRARWVLQGCYSDHAAAPWQSATVDIGARRGWCSRRAIPSLNQHITPTLSADDDQKNWIGEFKRSFFL